MLYIIRHKKCEMFYQKKEGSDKYFSGKGRMEYSASERNGGYGSPASTVSRRPAPSAGALPAAIH
jgi:hypothetical protein